MLAMLDILLRCYWLQLYIVLMLQVIVVVKQVWQVFSSTEVYITGAYTKWVNCVPVLTVSRAWGWVPQQKERLLRAWCSCTLITNYSKCCMYISYRATCLLPFWLTAEFWLWDIDGQDREETETGISLLHSFIVLRVHMVSEESKPWYWSWSDIQSSGLHRILCDYIGLLMMSIKMSTFHH